MSKDIKMYKLLISCPSDITEEKEIIEEEVRKFNEVYGDFFGIQIKTEDWKNVYPEYGDSAQNIINKQLLPKCDAVVALFWSRLGTPTDNYDSGTIEEIELMSAKGKHVSVYFSDNKINPSKINNEQLEKVNEFKKMIYKNGFIGEYSSLDEFREKFSSDLPKIFMNMVKNENSDLFKSSQLRLVGIDSKNNISEKAHIHKFNPEIALKKQDFKDRIIELLTEINQMVLAEKTSNKQNGLIIDLHQEVSISDEDKKIIKMVAEKLNFTISDNFFKLGQLKSSMLPNNGLYGGYSLKGSDDEIDKYNKIIDLKETIHNAMICYPFEENYFKLDVIKLALTNEGTTYDEDVELSLFLPEDTLIEMQELPKNELETNDYIMNDIGIPKIFGIHSSADYLNYFESENSQSFHPINELSEMLGSAEDYDDGYLNELSRVFCYSIFKKDGKMVLKLKVNYIKQNSAVAFPSVLFIKNGIDQIKYSITSKNQPSVIEGIIKVMKDDTLE